jgi:glyoxylase-like metal-dependent hydrolase (beta-lactamase superfamily II)
MHTRQIGENLFLIDLQTGGFRNLIASYLLRGGQTAIVETRPTSSIPNLLAGLRELDVKLEDVAYVAVTHVHIDHADGTGTLLKSMPNARVTFTPKAHRTWQTLRGSGWLHRRPWAWWRRCSENPNPCPKTG